MNRDNGLLEGQGFGRSSKKAHPTKMGGVDRVTLPNKPRAPFMPEAMVKMGPELREKMYTNFRNRKVRVAKSKSSPKPTFNAQPDKDNNPIWGD